MKQSELMIELAALHEQLIKYTWLTETYIQEIQKATSSLDLKKLDFCLTRTASQFESNYGYNCLEDENYIQIKKVLKEVKRHIEEKHQREKEIEPLMQFWTALNAWLEEEGKDPADIYNSKYQVDYQDWGGWWKTGNVDLDNLYKILYGKAYSKINEENISILVLKEFIEAYYREVIEPIKGRLKFTIKINDLLSRFQISYKLNKGKLIKIGYKTSYDIGEILNYEQFERKIDYTYEMIVHKDFLDKHTALNYISDAFCYFKSLYKVEKEADDKVNKKLAKLVDNDINSGVYSEVKKEIETILKLINNIFDIRHNEKYAYKKDGAIPKREALTDPIFVEYLYNRINSLLSLLRIKRNQQNVITNQLINAKSKKEIIDDNNDELPF